MIARQALATVAVAALAFVPAAASPGPGPISSPVDIRTLHVFAGCLADRYERPVRRLLAMDYRTSAYDDAMRTLIRTGESCVPFAFGRLRSSRVLVVGAFAEKLLPEALNGARLADRVAHDPASPAVVARDEGEYLGLCTVRTEPEEVAALFATRPASEEERLAIGRLIPKLGPCVRVGASARVNGAGLRALMALAAYRLASMERPPLLRPTGS